MSFIPIPSSRLAIYKTQFCNKASSGKYCPKGADCRYAHSQQEKREIFDPLPSKIKDLYSEKEIYGKEIRNFSKLNYRMSFELYH